MKNIDERVEKAIEYLADTDEPAAKSKTLYHGLEAQIKTVEATVFKGLSGQDMTIPEKNAEVHTSPWYTEHNKKIYAAMLDYEIFRNRRSTASIMVEYWRSLNANKRQG